MLRTQPGIQTVCKGGRILDTKNITWHESPVTRDDRRRLLQQRGVVVWLTGLSGAGKSALASGIESRLIQKHRLAYVLDGDNIRHGLNSDLGFSSTDREENIRRIAEVAALFCDAGLITIVSFISPGRKMRAQAREIIGSGQFLEIYVKADIETCAGRDPKGLYKKAINGEIADFTGISAGYEEPENPDLVVDTTLLSIEESVDEIMKTLSKKGGLYEA